MELTVSQEAQANLTRIGKRMDWSTRLEMRPHFWPWETHLTSPDFYRGELN